MKYPTLEIRLSTRPFYGAALVLFLQWPFLGLGWSMLSSILAFIVLLALTAEVKQR